MPTIHAVFIDEAGAQSAVGRLEIAGVPAENIEVSADEPLTPPRHRQNEVVVTAEVDSTHYEKALSILAAEGRVTVRADFRQKT